MGMLLVITTGLVEENSVKVYHRYGVHFFHDVKFQVLSNIEIFYIYYSDNLIFNYNRILYNKLIFIFEIFLPFRLIENHKGQIIIPGAATR